MMSLTMAQTVATKREFKENIQRSQLSMEQIASDLGTTPEVITQSITMHPRRIEDNWIIRNYLNEYLAAHQITEVPFTALTGDYHRYWFLNAAIIERGIID
ncbi:DUF2316 family protein [Lacticaseibacillus songhuajiangensis]|uniref:DUF2316 family protein n=1 Tax=Lacticaseibacillus songhuajiangensis TaxID=1296539 RepID=UPI001CDCF0D5|nr:DUF2316 family protein [Lacticaseibacillus songhuajiangensis]